MLTARNAFRRNTTSAPLLPQPPNFRDLWDGLGVRIRQSDVVMIAGRSGSQKSGFAMALCDEMNVPTLYFAADMSPAQVAFRMIGRKGRLTTEEIEQRMTDPEEVDRLSSMLDDSNISFVFGSPITLDNIEIELEAYVELYNRYPAIVVIDNLVDVEGCESDYAASMEAMAEFTGLAQGKNICVIVLHHASEKTEKARSEPGRPPSRNDIKLGLSEKPSLTLTVQYAGQEITQVSSELRIACVKQRMGRCDPTAATYARLQALPEYTTYLPGVSTWNTHTTQGKSTL